MKRLMLALVALAFSATVAANWVKVGETENYDAFIDRDTIVKNGQLRKFWMIRNLKMQSRVGQSDRFQEEYDCQEERGRTLYWSTHSGSMASGEMLGLIQRVTDWSPIPPHTIDWDILKFVCLEPDSATKL
jgi:hypothetical protein